LAKLDKNYDFVCYLSGLFVNIRNSLAELMELPLLSRTLSGW